MKNHGLPTDMKDFTPEQHSKFGSLSWDARMIAKRKQAKYQGEGDGIIVDGTGNSLQVMKDHVQEFKNKANNRFRQNLQLRRRTQNIL